MTGPAPRPLVRGDEARLTALLADCLDLDELSADLVAEKVWADAGATDESRLVIEGDGRLVAFGMAVTRPRRLGVIKILAVAASARRQGLGSMLLCELELFLRRCDVREIRLGESPPNYLWPGVDVGYTAAMFFFETHGYDRIGETFDMAISLESARMVSAPEVPPGFEISRARRADREEILAFMRTYWPAWEAEVMVCFSNRPISLLMVLHSGKIVGFVAYECNNRGRGTFGPIGMVPELRGQGIGRVLLLHCLTDMRERGFTTAIVPWVGPIEFYSATVDARIVRTFYRYSKCGAGCFPQS
jgi:ribosomal protein S18 acetylase RimI-like enzyme